MKIFKIYAIAVSLLMLMAACGKDDDNGNGGGVVTPPVIENKLIGIEGEWMLSSVNGVTPEFTVYICFSGDIFNLYQQLYTLDYVFYDGVFDVEGNILSGEYFDGELWKCSYDGELTENDNVLTLVSRETNPITNVYVRTAIPEDVIKEATTRSAVEFNYHL